MRVDSSTRAKNLRSISRVPRARSSVAVSVSTYSVVTRMFREARCAKMRRAAGCSRSFRLSRAKKPLLSTRMDLDAIDSAVDFLVVQVSFGSGADVVLHVEDGVVWRDLIRGGMSRCDRAHSLPSIG